MTYLRKDRRCFFTCFLYYHTDMYKIYKCSFRCDFLSKSLTAIPSPSLKVQRAVIRYCPLQRCSRHCFFWLCKASQLRKINTLAARHAFCSHVGLLYQNWQDIEHEKNGHSMTMQICSSSLECGCCSRFSGNQNDEQSIYLQFF